jgi:hypothetical protein
MRNEPGEQDYSETPPVRRCGHCGEPMLSQRKRARYCGRRCKELAREARKRASERLTTLRRNHPFADVSLAELHERARPPQHRAGDDLLEYSDRYDAGVYDDDGLDDDEDQVLVVDDQGARIRSMLDDADPRTPRETRALWRTYGRRHGTEHPDQTTDRVERQQAAERAAGARRDANTGALVQSRHDPRTTGSVAHRGTESRRLNLRHADLPPMPPRGYDFGAPSSPNRASGHEGRYGGSAWAMEDGFVY